MNIDGIERRQDPRTEAFVPVTFSAEGVEEETPAHLLDLSSGGAAVLTTAYDAPLLGQYLDLNFEFPQNNEDGEIPIRRSETGLVVNVRNQESGVTRLGIRFLQSRGMSADLFDPREILSNHRKSQPVESLGRRWETARIFGIFNQPFATVNKA
ncbi:MAG: PilZ domain-containing protein [Phycisphaerales bacterium]|nr:PilZ domain-containing protein [Phycisphaerales bacterium]